MSLRDEILKNAKENITSRKPKEDELQEVLKEVCRLIEFKMKKRGIREVYKESGWLTKSYSPTGEKIVAEHFHICFTCRGNGFHGVEVRPNSEGFGIDVENTYDMRKFLEYLKNYCNQNDLLIYGYRNTIKDIGKVFVLDKNEIPDKEFPLKKDAGKQGASENYRSKFYLVLRI